jgi:hypothetical protein
MSSDDRRARQRRKCRWARRGWPTALKRRLDLGIPHSHRACGGLGGRERCAERGDGHIGHVRGEGPTHHGAVVRVGELSWRTEVEAWEGVLLIELEVGGGCGREEGAVELGCGRQIDGADPEGLVFVHFEVLKEIVVPIEVLGTASIGALES